MWLFLRQLNFGRVGLAVYTTDFYTPKKFKLGKLIGCVLE
jgi:hypothetical protein